MQISVFKPSRFAGKVQRNCFLVQKTMTNILTDIFFFKNNDTKYEFVVDNVFDFNLLKKKNFFVTLANSESSNSVSTNSANSEESKEKIYVNQSKANEICMFMLIKNERIPYSVHFLKQEMNNLIVYDISHVTLKEKMDYNFPEILGPPKFLSSEDSFKMILLFLTNSDVNINIYLFEYIKDEYKKYAIYRAPFLIKRNSIQPSEKNGIVFSEILEYNGL